MTLLEQLAQPLLTARQDFSAAFMIINQIRATLPETPDAGLASLFQICEQLMTDPGYQCQKQAYFFYRSVAQTLQRVALRSNTGEDPAPRRALQMLNTGMIRRDPETVLELYFRQCSVSVTCEDMAVMAATLAMEVSGKSRAEAQAED